MKKLIVLYCCLFGLQAVSQKLTQTISGKVRDDVTQAALIGATVKVLNTEPLLGGIADVEGTFIIENVPIGRYDVEVTFIGYEPILIPEVLLTSGKSVQLNFRMKESIEAMEEVIITAEFEKDKPINEMAAVSARSFTVEESRRYAGGFDDPGRLAQAFAGVASNSIGDNGIQIRGNAPKGVQWRIEGVEVASPSHFNGADVSGGGFLTLLSSHVLDNSDFYTGAFPAEYGNALAGVFDINLRTGNPIKRESTFQAGMLGVDFASEGPFKKGGKGTYLFNYRYSTFGLIQPLLPDDAAALNYQDLSFKLHFPTKAGTFQLWGINGIDNATTNNVLNPDSTQWETWDDFANNDFGFHLSTTGINHLITAGKDHNTFVKSSVAFALNDGFYKEEMMAAGNRVVPNSSIDQRYTTFTASSQLNHKFSSRFNIRTGFIFRSLGYDLTIRSADNKSEPLLLRAEDSGATDRLQYYAQGQWYIGQNFTLNAGLHGQYVSLLGEATFEPRAGLQWKYNESAALSFGYGNHSQMEDIKTYFVVDQSGTLLNKNLKLGRAHHLVVGWDKQLTSHSRIKVEPYVQLLYRVPVIADSTFSMSNFVQDWYFDGDLVSDGEGLNYGIDLTLERFLNKNYYYLLTGSVFKSRYKDGLNQWHDSHYDRGFNFDFLVGKEWKINGNKNKFIGFNTRMNLMGGLKNSPIDAEASLAAQEELYDETRPFIDQDPMTYMVDMTVTLRKNRAKYSSVWAFQIKNMLGSQSNYGYIYNYATDTMDEDVSTIMIPNISWKIEF